MKTIKSKIQLSMLLAALIPVFCVAAYVYYSTAKALTHSASDSLGRNLELLANSIEGTLAYVPGDLFYLRDANSMFNYGRALVIRDEKLLELNGRDMARDFLSIVKSRGIYNQIRFIAADGQELIRVEHNEQQGSSRILQPELLRNKKESIYFQKASKLQFGEIYISQLDLNREDGELEEPIRPTLRFATPIFAVGSRLVGVLMINVDAYAFIDQIDQANLVSDIKFSISNSEGFYVAHKNRDKLFGGALDLAHGESLSIDYPEVQALASSSLIANIDQSEQLLSSVTLFADSRKTVPIGKLVAYAPKSVVLKLLDSFVVAFVFVLIISGFMALIVASLLSTRLTAPLSYLSDAADRLSKGDIERPISIKSGDELEVLGDAFERLRESLRFLMKMK